jgi:hypothetical protein
MLVIGAAAKRNPARFQAGLKLLPGGEGAESLPTEKAGREELVIQREIEAYPTTLKAKRARSHLGIRKLQRPESEPSPSNLIPRFAATHLAMPGVVDADG